MLRIDYLQPKIKQLFKKISLNKLYLFYIYILHYRIQCIYHHYACIFYPSIDLEHHNFHKMLQYALSYNNYNHSNRSRHNIQFSCIKQ
jgi:hypothetical protein